MTSLMIRCPLQKEKEKIKDKSINKYHANNDFLLSLLWHKVIELGFNKLKLVHDSIKKPQSVETEFLVLISLKTSTAITNLILDLRKTYCKDSVWIVSYRWETNPNQFNIQFKIQFKIMSLNYLSNKLLTIKHSTFVPNVYSRLYIILDPHTKLWLAFLSWRRLSSLFFTPIGT